MDEIVFNRPKKYSMIRELGSGACGKTLLLNDLDLEMEVVAKKYAPLPELDQDTKKEFLQRFRKEAQILLRATHDNVVRVYTYYDYPEASSAFFIMEFVDGRNILEYVEAYPSSCESLFRETIAGFCYLANKGITHRDIRPQNVLVGANGSVKIIDFGFAKTVHEGAGKLSAEFVKSVTLNWWAGRPTDFLTNVYDETTEVYFVGKLLEEMVRLSGVRNFRYLDVIAKMSAIERDQRVPSFADVSQLVSQVDLGSVSFSPLGVTTYRDFSKTLAEAIVRIEEKSKYHDDIPNMIASLERLHKSVLLEEHVPDIVKLIRIFVSGSYTYRRGNNFPVELLANFITLLRSLDPARQEIILANLASRLDSIVRYSEVSMDDDIPF